MPSANPTLHLACIHAHPDDAEFLCGGSLVRWRSAGHRVTIVTMTAGDCGSRLHSPDEISAIRQREAASSASLIGASYRWAGFQDLAIFSDDASRRRVTALLREIRPDVVLTASPEDYHCDHEATSALVRDACFAAPAPNYKAGSLPPLDHIPHLYFVDSLGGVDRDARSLEADFYVDVEPYMDQKRRMLELHESQRQWLKDHHGMDNYLAEMEQWTAECGRRAGLRYAEGFRRYRGHPYPQEPLLESLSRP